MTIQEQAAAALAKLHGADTAVVDEAAAFEPVMKALGGSDTIPNGMLPPVVALEHVSTEDLEAMLAKRKALAQEFELLQQALHAGKGRVFHTRIPNSTFLVQKKDKEGKPLMGQVKVLQFHGNNLFVDDEEAILQLSEIADTPGSQIYLNPANARTPVEDSEAFEAVRNRAAQIVEQMAAAGMHV